LLVSFSFLVAREPMRVLAVTGVISALFPL
jgi:hypothetical protein